MIVGAEVYCASQQAAMNCSIQQYETMHFQSHWPLSHQPIHSVIKKEPTEENEFFKGDKSMFTGPLTPPGLNYSNVTEYQSGPAEYQRGQEYQRPEYQAYQKPADYAAGSPSQPDYQRSSPSDFHRSQSSQEYRKEQRASPTFQELHQGQAFEKSSQEFQRSTPEARPTQVTEYQRASPGGTPQQGEVQRASPGARPPAEQQTSPGTSPRASPPLASLMPAVTLTEGLTPPGSSPDQLPPKEDDSSADSLGRLQMALQRHGLMYEEKLQCPMCEFSCSVRSTFNEHLLLHETKCTICEFNGETKEKLREHMKNVHDTVMPEEDSWGEDEPGLTTPKVNSQGKVKTFRCKQCDFCAVTKAGFWEHSKVHIKRDRILTCPKCPFITEYKHHLEYHLRNHFGSKPFKCDKCSYTCVNKSMLNSHLKSHSNVYQFRCSDCTYATKYCHSLKLHLRKYGHSPAMVLNSDGSPNPLPIVDVYGTRRGPKQKKEAQPTVPLFNPYGFLPQQLPYYGLLNAFQPFPFTPEEKNNNQVKTEEEREEKSPLDLTCPEPTEPTPELNAESPEQPKGNRRKGKAYKIDKIALRLQQQEPQDAKRARQEAPSPVKACEADSEQTHKDEYDCSYCDISFKDIVMYTMHMGYHGYQDPFQCNMCGQQTADKVAFFLHIARTSHS